MLLIKVHLQIFKMEAKAVTLEVLQLSQEKEKAEDLPEAAEAAQMLETQVHLLEELVDKAEAETVLENHQEHKLETRIPAVAAEQLADKLVAHHKGPLEVLV